MEPTTDKEEYTQKDGNDMQVPGEAISQIRGNMEEQKTREHQDAVIMIDDTKEQHLMVFQEENREPKNQKDKEEEEDAEDITQNVKKVIKDADLSPRHKKDLQNMTKKESNQETK